MIVAWVMEETLAVLGCEVVGPAARVHQALAMAKADGIDAAVLDVNLNGEMSFPVADALAARGVPFAFTTGYSQDSLPVGYRHVPMLQKPYTQQKLADTLEQLLVRNTNRRNE